MTESKMARGVIRTTVVTATAAACLIGVPTSGATFRGANGLLVYQAQAGKHIQLFTIRPEGTGRRQITHLRDSDALNPAWSPDGRRIVFARDYMVGTGHEHLDIVTVNADGGGLHGMALRGLNGDPTWSPDGRILWLRPGGFAISRAEGNGFRMIRVAGENSSPTVSPDGRQIAFRRQLGEHKSAIFVVSAKGGPARRVVAPAGGVADKIDWSPDGSRIVLSAPEFGAGKQRVVERLHDPARRERPAAAHALAGRQREQWRRLLVARRQAHRVRQQPRRRRVRDLGDERRRHARHRRHPHRSRRTPRRLGNQSLTRAMRSKEAAK